MRHTVLFWNLNPPKGDQKYALDCEVQYAKMLARLASEHHADLVVLADCPIGKTVLLDSLREVDEGFDVPEDTHPKMTFFARLPGRRLEVLKEDGRVSIRRLTDDTKAHDDVLLAATHFVDPYNNCDSDQARAAEVLRDTILAAEAMPGVGHKRTILFGDLNMSPYHVPMIDPWRGLGAMMSRELAKAHEKYPYEDDEYIPPDRFYNPMWSRLGDPACPGTFYWDKNRAENPYWHTIDGVLVRPAMLDSFENSSDNPYVLRTYRDATGEQQPLIRLAKKHYKITFSDHLPLLFRFSLPPKNGGV